MHQSTNIAADKADRPVIPPPERDAAMFQQAAPTIPPLQQNEQKKGWWENTKASFQSMLPDWAIKNSTRINQLGLMAGTAVIMGSVLRGKKIGKDIWEAQEAILKEKGFHGAALEKKIAELVQSKVMKKPSLHPQRTVYLSTAVAGLGIGGFIKDKETAEDRAQHVNMPLPQYMAMRFGQAFDPMHHSRQTAGLVGAASGVLAIISAFSQPGGALVSEAFVGATLVSGFSGLTFIDDPAQAKQALNVCWATRLPFVLSGTYETLLTKPAFMTPLAAELKKTTAYSEGLMKAMQEGVKVPRFGLAGLAGKKLVKGGKAADAFTKSFVSCTLPYKRMDVSYPIGQWFNMTMATFGFLTAGADEKKYSATQTDLATPEVVVMDTHGKPVPQGPSTTIGKPQLVARMQDQPDLQPELAAARS